MNIQRQKNLWGCTAGAAAMLFDITIKEFYRRVGHDGGEIINPSIPSPGNRKGFHMQEVIAVGLELGIGLIPIEAAPAQTALGSDIYDVIIHGFEDSGAWMLHNMCGHPGLIVGKLGMFWHCVSWDGGIVYDPRGEIYPLCDCKIDIQTFWRLTYL